MTSRRDKPKPEVPVSFKIHPVSVIVPTFREGANIEPLTRRLFKATRDANIPIELVFVDDDSGCVLLLIFLSVQLRHALDGIAHNPANRFVHKQL